MSLFGSLMGDVEDDPFFGSHMRHMRQMNNMMNSLLSDPFGMFGGGASPFAIMGPRHSSAMMPFMPQMPSLNRLFSGNMADMDGGMSGASSYSSSISIMSNGPGGKPQVFQQSSSTKIGPNGVKETRKTLQDTRTGTKKMSIGHHIGERAHVIEREQNVYSGDHEERQEFINLDEDEAEDFDREFQEKSGGYTAAQRLRLQESRESRQPTLAIMPASTSPAPTSRTSEHRAARRSNLSNTTDSSPRVTDLSTHRVTDLSTHRVTDLATHSVTDMSTSGRRSSDFRPVARKPLRSAPSSSGASVREVYSGSHPQRHKHRHHKNRHSDQ